MYTLKDLLSIIIDREKRKASFTNLYTVAGKGIPCLTSKEKLAYCTDCGNFPCSYVPHCATVALIRLDDAVSIDASLARPVDRRYGVPTPAEASGVAAE